MYNKLLMRYEEEIKARFNHAKIIEENISIPSVREEAYSSAIINMCIKYEAMTSDIEELVFKNSSRYNKPWSNTRRIAKNMNIDIKIEYKLAHDAWDIYNCLKHINDITELELKKIFKKYNLNSSKQAAIFVRKSLLNLINKFIEK